MHRLPLVTVSQARTFRRCHREHYLAYELGYRPISDAEALLFGRLWHVGQESWWGAVMLGRPDDALEAAIAGMRLGVAANDYELVKAEELMRGYHFRWGDDLLDVHVVEKEFQTDLLNPETGAASRTYQLGGKVDAIASVRQGHPDRAPGVYVVEHKTTSEDIGLGSTYWQRLRLDAQVSIYFEGARSLGHDVVGCLYDVVRKPGIRPSAVALVDAEGVKIVHDASGQRVRTKDGKKWRETGDTAQGYVLQTRPETPEEFRARLRSDIAENPDRYYQRGTVVRLAEEMRDAAADTWQTARLIREAELAKRHPRNPDACVRYGRVCSYFGVCTGAAQLDDATQFRRVENPHQELAADPAA